MKGQTEMDRALAWLRNELVELFREQEEEDEAQEDADSVVGQLRDAHDATASAAYERGREDGRAEERAAVVASLLQRAEKDREQARGCFDRGELSMGRFLSSRADDLEIFAGQFEDGVHATNADMQEAQS